MIDLDSMSDDDKLAALESIHKSIAESKELQKQKIAANVDLVLQALKKMESDIRARYDETGKTIEKRVASIKDGRDGRNGLDGKNGKDGRNGKDGVKGDKGDKGLDGIDGVDGVDGVSVIDAKIDFDGSLIITLSTGQEINVGEVVSPDLADKIQVISTMSTNGAVGISDEGSSISTGVKNINFVGATVTATNSGDDVTVNVSAGTGTVTSVAVSGGTTGLTTSGGPITTTGTITLGGTLAVASGGTGTATPGLVAGTNITSITGSWPNQTINAGGGSGTVTSVAATVPAFLSVTGSPITTSGTLAIGLSGSALPVANGGTGVTTSTGTTNVVLSNSPTLVTPALGTPSSATLTNATGLPIATGVSGLGTGVATFLATPSSANLASAITDETGSGSLVFATSPTLVTPALGTPASGVVTNLTGTASININGTVGATTPDSGAFTTLSATGVTTVQAGTAALPAITTTGDTNTGIFFPAADTIAFSEGGAEAMRIDQSGNVGVGSTTVIGKVQVNVGDVTPTSTSANMNGFVISNGGGGNGLSLGTADSGGYNWISSGYVNSASTGRPLAFLTAGTERARIDSSGNVGIGTSSPTSKLHVVSSSGENKIISEATAASQQASLSLIVQAATPGQTVIYMGKTGATTNGQLGYDPNTNAMTMYTNNAERMRIDSSGNVGIGTSSPNYKFNVGPTSGVLSLAGAGISLFTTGSLTSNIGGVLNFRPSIGTTASDIFNLSICAYDHSGDSNADGLSINASDGISFCTGSNSRQERGRFDGSGNLLVGTTSALGKITSSSSFNPNSSDWDTTAALSTTGSFGGGLVMVDGSAGYGLYCADSGNDFYIQGSNSLSSALTGGVYLNDRATSWSSASDERLKTIIEPITDAVSKVCQLRTVIGRYNYEPEGKRHPFLIAQDVQAVLPEAVSVADKKSEEQYLGVSYTDTIPLLVAAIKEQQALITALTTRITALENK